MTRSPVLVTGAGGFIGRHLVRHLCENGHTVRALDLKFHKPVPGDVEAIEGSILDQALVNKAMENVVTVFHLAAITDLWTADPASYDTVNVSGTQCVLDAALKADVGKFVHCSSYVTLIAGSRTPERLLDETHFPDHDAMLGAYARSKHAADTLVSAVSNHIQTAIVLPSAPVGPGDLNMTPPSRLLMDLANGAIPATLNCMMNLVDVRQLASGIAAAAHDGQTGQRYLLTGCDVAMADFVAKVGTISGLPMPKHQVPYPLAWLAGAVEEKLVSPISGKRPKGPLSGVRLAGRHRKFDNTKARATLDFAQTDLDAAIRDALVWMRSNGLITRLMPGLQDQTLGAG